MSYHGQKLLALKTIKFVETADNILDIKNSSDTTIAQFSNGNIILSGGNYTGNQFITTNGTESGFLKPVTGFIDIGSSSNHPLRLNVNNGTLYRWILDTSGNFYPDFSTGNIGTSIKPVQNITLSGAIYSNVSTDNYIDPDISGNFTLSSRGSFNAIIDSDNNTSNAVFAIYKDPSTLLFTVNEAGTHTLKDSSGNNIYSTTDNKFYIEKGFQDKTDTRGNADSPYSIPLGIRTIYVNAGSGVTFNLPNATTAGSGYEIIFIDKGNANGTTNIITINGTSGQTINGNSSITITTAYGVVRIKSDSANWFQW